MINNKLTKLDFTPGIKARDINYNFDVMNDALRRERRRIGGYGIVEGFDISPNVEDFHVTIDNGILINRQGDELIIPKTTFSAGAPDYVAREERIICPADGIITLSDAPYSPTKYGHVKYVPPFDKVLPPRDEFAITCELENRTVPYIQLSDNKVYVNNATYWFGKELTFRYYVAGDRVDAILIHEDGTYRYERSIVSKNPAHVDITDYDGGDKNYMMVGVVHWVVDDHVRAIVYTNHRTYRPLYMSDDDRLFIYGKEYREPRVIYFQEPADPQEDDMWYDKEHETLLIYRFKDGKMGWYPVNDFSTITVRETKIWAPEEWPADRQTFLFGKDDINLNFVPNTNALEIYMDNAVFMKDQFTEIVSTAHNGAPGYMAQGIGFRLVEPMDRPTYLQVTVNHQVRTSPLREVFQRAAIFVVENHAYQTDANSRQIYKTEYPYVVGANQLECWVDGIRLVSGVDFEELKEDTSVPTDDEKATGSLMSHYFVVKKKLQAGQLVNHKISKHIWSYDQVALLLSDIRDDITDLQDDTQQLRTDVDTMDANVSSQLANFTQQLSLLQNNFNALANKQMADEAVKMKHLEAEIKKHMLGDKQCCQTMPATNITPIAGFTDKDFLQVYLISEEDSRILIKGVDYTIANTNQGARIDLATEYLSSGNTVCVTGFTIGVK